MNTSLIARFAPVIRTLTVDELNGAASLNDKLRMAGDRSLEVCYAPFEHLNTAARIVIVGITPGRTQMLNAIKEARRQLDHGADFQHVLYAAKTTGAFSGAMRPNLVRLLDCVGLNRWMGIESCSTLFTSAGHLVQTSSVLRHPVFISGKNYNGTPNMIRSPLLRQQLLAHFAKAMTKAVFVPLGDKVAEALNFLSEQGVIDQRRVLDGLPHPSGANAERIAYFLGRKRREHLSSKTNAGRLDDARERMLRKVESLA